jgi:hypothetical protein
MLIHGNMGFKIESSKLFLYLYIGSKLWLVNLASESGHCIVGEKARVKIGESTARPLLCPRSIKRNHLETQHQIH